MDPETPPTTQGRNLKPMYWLAAVAMAIATVLSSIEKFDWLAVVGRGSLVAALVMLATAKPQVTRAWKIGLYALIALSIGLFIARLAQ